MLMTEKEAAQKRCTPMASVIPLLLLREGAHDAATATGTVSPRCIGSACAQWCWFDYVNTDGVTFKVPNDSTAFTKGRATKGPTAVAAPGRGYCGLTGARE